MTELVKNRWGQIIQTVLAMIGGGILTLIFNVATETKVNSSDIAVIKAQIDPLRGVVERLSSLETKSDRNYDMLKTMQNSIELHVNKDK
jgi:hypothetical protein